MIIRRCALLMLCGILTMSILLLSCAQPESTLPSEQRPQNVKLTIVGFRAGSGQQLRADAIAEAIRLEYPDWNVTSLAAGGEAQVINKRVNSEADYFFSMYPRSLELEAHVPLHPEIDFEEATAYSAVMPLANRPLHLLVMTKTGLTSIRDIVDKEYPFTAGIGAGVARILFGNILEYYGSSLAETKAWGAKYEPVIVVTPDGVDALRTGRIDIGFSWSALPSPMLMGATFDLKLLPIDDPGLVKMFQPLGYEKVTIPAGTYSFVDRDIDSITDYEFLTVRPDIPDDVVYYTLKALFNHEEILIASTADIEKQLVPEAIANSLKLIGQSGIPTQPGALKFYREMGWVE
ncbi:TAXI family TRAP transporter solute-binding subunit [Chloroflexota bacterium]